MKEKGIIFHNEKKNNCYIVINFSGKVRSSSANLFIVK